MRILLIDNYDSFTFNVAHALVQAAGHHPLIAHNDALTWQEITALAPDCIVISPGPGQPGNQRDFGISKAAVERATCPVLGVCLGHQGIALFCGGTVGRAAQPFHGRLSDVWHSRDGLFAGVPNPFPAVRYHSLAVQRVPGVLEVTAWTADGVVMALRHRQRPLYGVQFHPESVCTRWGPQILGNFLSTVKPSAAPSPLWEKRAAQATAAPTAPITVAVEPLRLFSRKLGRCPAPEETFTRLFGAAENAFWLDSAGGQGSDARFSYMGAADAPDAAVYTYRVNSGQVVATAGGETRAIDTSIFSFLKHETAATVECATDVPFPFRGGFVGYIGYEMKGECGSLNRHVSRHPDAAFIRVTRFLAFDHLQQAAWLVAVGRADAKEQIEAWFTRIEAMIDEAKPLKSAASPGSNASACEVVIDCAMPAPQYRQAIKTCLEHLHAGDSYELCLTTQFSANVQADPLVFYRCLRQRNPAPYSAYVRIGGLAVACSSPELFLRVGRDGSVESKPIKGTAARHADAAADMAARNRLRQSEKDKAENLMIVDLLRNDLSRACQPGSVHVPRLMAVETYATVHQLVSTVRGRLAAGTSAVDCLMAAFPGGSMTGAPKLRTLELLDALEAEPRGIYSGTLGWVGFGGGCCLNIVIRTAVLEAGRVTVGAGGAIVAMSDPQSEWNEVCLKAQPLLDVLRACCAGG